MRTEQKAFSDSSRSDQELLESITLLDSVLALRTGEREDREEQNPVWITMGSRFMG